MNIKRFLLAILISFVSISYIKAYNAISQQFIDAPFDLIPTISRSTRMDMLDYYESGLARPSTSYFGDEILITELTDNSLSATTSDHCQIKLYLSTLDTDTFTVAIETIQIPAEESRIYIYDKNWNLVTYKDSGVIKEWTNGVNDNNLFRKIENAVSFITAKADFNPDTNILTLSSTLEQRGDCNNEEFKHIAPYLKPSRSFILNKKGFVEIK